MDCHGLVPLTLTDVGYRIETMRTHFSDTASVDRYFAWSAGESSEAAAHRQPQ
jgi:hypothetical protein